MSRFYLSIRKNSLVGMQKVTHPPQKSSFPRLYCRRATLLFAQSITDLVLEICIVLPHLFRQ